jgi:hypothetical protein
VTGPADLWPVAPVLTQARLQLGPDATLDGIGDLLGIPPATVGQWTTRTRQGRIRGRRAEQVAHALGLEPVMLWPDWYPNPDRLVDVRWIAETYYLHPEWVRQGLTKEPWFPKPISRARKRAEWAGHHNCIVWEREEVDEAMASIGFGPEAPGQTLKEIAAARGLSIKTLTRWSYSRDGFPPPVTDRQPRRFDPAAVDEWVDHHRDLLPAAARACG